MTAVALTSFWLNDAADPTDALSIPYMPESYDVASSLGGGVESGYASGRSRGWSTADDGTTVTLSLESVSVADVAWLKAHRGRPLSFRDPLGLKVFVQYQDVQASFSARGGVNTGQLTLTSVTVSEAV